AAAQCQGRHAVVDESLAWKLESFITAEEERLVPSVVPWPGDRAADENAIVVHDRLRLRTAERIPCVQRSILVVLEDTSVQLIRSALRYCGDVAHSAEFSGI